MLYASLVCSGIILIASILAARFARHPVFTTIAWAVGIAVLPIMLIMVFPAVWLQMAILVGGLLLVGLFGYARRSIVPLSVVAVLVAYGVTSYSAMAQQQTHDRLRAQYPLESLEARLPRPVPPSTSGDSRVLLRLEEAVEKGVASGRGYELARLHSDTVDNFVNSPGFGVARMSRGVVSETVLGVDPRDDAPVQEDYFRLSPKDLEKLPARPNESVLGSLHESGFLDFVNPRGFGYVKNRREVAGFQSHGFSKVPEPAGEWKVASLELVGLLRHDDPVVYVSNKLPKMNELQEAKTRQLDPFESTALTALREGADLHMNSEENGVRFLGAIRSTKQCVGCHGGERGALLGAFTYRLTPVAR